MKDIVKKGDEQTLDLLAQEALRGRNIKEGVREALVLCLDTSGSMLLRAPKTEISNLQAMRQAALDLVRASKSSHVGIVSYGTVATLAVPVGSREAAGEAIRRLEAQGNTSIRRGLQVAGAALLAGAALSGLSVTYPVRRIVLMSDGFSTDCDWRDVVGLAKEMHDEYSILIDTVAFSADVDHKMLAEIAQVANGVAKYAATSRELIAAFRSLEASKRGIIPARKP